MSAAGHRYDGDHAPPEPGRRGVGRVIADVGRAAVAWSGTSTTAVQENNLITLNGHWYCGRAAGSDSRRRPPAVIEPLR